MAGFVALAGAATLHAQADAASIIRRIDAAAMARVNSIAGYTVTEHYSVFRNHDETHPAAEMTVKTTYKKETGKSYQIQSESGSAVLRKFVLGAILDNEKALNQPGTREGSWIVTANYEMQLKSGDVQSYNGRDCYEITLTPKRKAPFLIDGTLWVDAKDGTIVAIEGQSSKSPSVFTGPTQMMRQYVKIDGFGMATHARAVSHSALFGETVVTIDYSNYSIQVAHPQ